MTNDPNNPNQGFPPQQPPAQPQQQVPQAAPQQYQQPPMAQQPPQAPPQQAPQAAPGTIPQYGSSVDAVIKAVTESDGLFWKVPDGGSTIRILPANPNVNPLKPGLFFQEASYHTWNDETYECPSDILKKSCPFCECRMAIWRNAKSQGRDGQLTAEEKAWARKYNTRSSYIANIIVRGEEDKGVRVWRFGFKMKQMIVGWVSGEFGDITDTVNGRDIVINRTINRTAEGAFPNYDNSHPRLETSPLGTSEQVVLWMESQHNLVDIIEPRVREYEELHKICWGMTSDEMNAQFGGKLSASQKVLAIQRQHGSGGVLPQYQQPSYQQQPPYQQPGMPPQQPPQQAAPQYQQPPQQAPANQPAPQGDPQQQVNRDAQAAAVFPDMNGATSGPVNAPQDQPPAQPQQPPAQPQQPPAQPQDQPPAQPQQPPAQPPNPLHGVPQSVDSASLLDDLEAETANIKQGEGGEGNGQ